MFAIFLFLVYLAVFTYLFVPSRPVSAVPTTAQIETQTVPDPLPETVLQPHTPDFAHAPASLPVTPEDATAIDQLFGNLLNTFPEQDAEETNTISPRCKNGDRPLNAKALRKECGKRGIRWRNAHGPNKHLSRDEMLNALNAA